LYNINVTFSAVGLHILKVEDDDEYVNPKSLPLYTGYFSGLKY
jgi:hypothetical protein